MLIFETLLGLLAASVVLELLARTFQVPSAVALVLGGMALALSQGYRKWLSILSWLSPCSFRHSYRPARSARTGLRSSRTYRSFCCLRSGCALYGRGDRGHGETVDAEPTLGGRDRPWCHRRATGCGLRHVRVEEFQAAPSHRHGSGRREPDQRRLGPGALPVCCRCYPGRLHQPVGGLLVVPTHGARRHCCGPCGRFCGHLASCAPEGSPA